MLLVLRCISGILFQGKFQDIGVDSVNSFLRLRPSRGEWTLWLTSLLVVIVLWVVSGNAAMVACFTMFFLNDMYGFINWRRMQKQQDAR